MNSLGFVASNHRSHLRDVKGRIVAIGKNLGRILSEIRSVIITKLN